MSVIEEYTPVEVAGGYRLLRGLARKAAIQRDRDGRVNPRLIAEIEAAKAALDQERGRT